MHVAEIEQESGNKNACDAKVDSSFSVIPDIGRRWTAHGSWKADTALSFWADSAQWCRVRLDQGSTHIHDIHNNVHDIEDQ